MPRTTVHLFVQTDGTCPVLDWLHELGRTNTRAVDACIARIRLLAQLGHELRRPHADLLRNGIYELRVGVGRVNYRILYFFHGKDVAIVAHGPTKEAEMPARDLTRALERKARYEKAPQAHTKSFND